MAEAEVTRPPSQAARPAAQASAAANRSVNVGDLERWLSIVGGSLLAVHSLRNSLGNLALLAGAGALIYRGMTGHCALYQTMDISTVADDNTYPDRTRQLPRNTESSTTEPSRIVLARS
jgi:hypothetical protein